MIFRNSSSRQKARWKWSDVLFPPSAPANTQSSSEKLRCFVVDSSRMWGGFGAGGGGKSRHKKCFSRVGSGNCGRDNSSSRKKKQATMLIKDNILEWFEHRGEMKPFRCGELGLLHSHGGEGAGVGCISSSSGQSWNAKLQERSRFIANTKTTADEKRELKFKKNHFPKCKTLMAAMILRFCIKPESFFSSLTLPLVRVLFFCELWVVMRNWVQSWVVSWIAGFYLAFTKSTTTASQQSDTKSQLSVAWNEDTTTRCLFRLDEQNENSWKLRAHSRVSAVRCEMTKEKETQRWK